MSTQAIIIPSEVKDNPFKKVAQELSARAMAVQQITDVEEFKLAGKMFQTHAGAVKQIESFYDPHIARAREPWDALCQEKRDIIAGLTASKKHLDRLMSSWEAEQERQARQAREAAEKAQREAEAQRQAEIKSEEDRRLEAAQILQDEGLTTEANALLEAPVASPGPILPPPVPAQGAAIPKVQGVSGRSNWKGRLRPSGGPSWPAEVSEEDQAAAMKQLCRAIGEGKVPPQVVELNQSALNKLAGSLKQMLGYPGIEVYDDKIRVGRS